MTDTTLQYLCLKTTTVPRTHTSNTTEDIERRTPRQLLPGFYRQYGLDADGGQSSPYVRIGFGNSFFLYFPNTDARRKAVLKHDVHHLVTGYTSTFRGETEIGAWEIGSGCRHYLAAFFLNLHAMVIGILFNAAGVYHAFIRGRRTKNLYADLYTDKQLLDIPVHQIKQQLLLNAAVAKKTTPADILLFVSILVAGSVYSILSLVLLPVVVFYTLWIVLRKRGSNNGRN